MEAICCGLSNSVSIDAADMASADFAAYVQSLRTFPAMPGLQCFLRHGDAGRSRGDVWVEPTSGVTNSSARQTNDTSVYDNRSYTILVAEMTYYVWWGVTFIMIFAKETARRSDGSYYNYYYYL